uniref:Centromere protein K n=1 Tax=Hucho hucho TaxID=62062 RepID=A0A4W5KL65_9TELE
KEVFWAENDTNQHIENYPEFNMKVLLLLSVLQDTKKKIQMMKDYQDRLMETLADVLEEHFPLPTQETNADRRKKLNENLISLNKILELLMNKTLATPHHPYISIDETFWPPYTEMLLRYGIAQRHPEDCFKIRLETFY